ncbi:MAG TPA: hypothetical protein VJ378_02760 [Candidatus Paceibacterota bacterium]|nr:hypothetical protein [Candidatus Paceibacterota bacterium]
MQFFKVEVVHHDSTGCSIQYKKDITPEFLQTYIQTSLIREKDIKEQLAENESKVVVRPFCPWDCSGKHSFNLTKLDQSEIPKRSTVISI